jgi:hypothetical protein
MGRYRGRAGVAQAEHETPSIKVAGSTATAHEPGHSGPRRHPPHAGTPAPSQTRSYLQFELTWAYAPNVVAGEDIRIIWVREDEWPPELPRQDLWLFDDVELFAAHYADDGLWLGVERIRGLLTAATRGDEAIELIRAVADSTP